MRGKSRSHHHRQQQQHVPYHCGPCRHHPRPRRRLQQWRRERQNGVRRSAAAGERSGEWAGRACDHRSPRQGVWRAPRGEPPPEGARGAAARGGPRAGGGGGCRRSMRRMRRQNGQRSHPRTRVRHRDHRLQTRRRRRASTRLHPPLHMRPPPLLLRRQSRGGCRLTWQHRWQNPATARQRRVARLAWAAAHRRRTARQHGTRQAGRAAGGCLPLQRVPGCQQPRQQQRQQRQQRRRAARARRRCEEKSGATAGRWTFLASERADVHRW